jgi:hypothetical protein
MSSNLQQGIFMQRDRESKQSTGSNIQQEMSSSNVKDSKQKQWRACPVRAAANNGR